MKPLQITLAVIGGLLLVVAVVLTWVVGTASGTRWLLETASGRLPALTIDRSSGALAGELDIQGLRWAPAGAGTRVEVQTVTVDLGLLDLLRGVLRVESASVEGVDAVLGSTREAQPRPSSRRSPLEPPIDLVVDRFALRDALLRNAGAGDALLDVREAYLAGSWTSSGIAVEQFDLDAADGSVHLSGTATSGAPWAVDSRGRFEWQIGGTNYAGWLEVGTSEGTTRGQIALSAPFLADLQGSIRTAQALAWKATLDAPEFEPPAGFPLAGRFDTVAVHLTASGTVDAVSLSGRVALDGVALLVEAAEIEQTPTAIAIDEIVLAVADRPGRLRASGTIATDVAPVRADLGVTWAELELPAQWVGQALHTHGDIDVTGSTAQFDVRGDLAAGPDREGLAQIALAVTGSTRRLAIEQFDVVQASGRLAVHGFVDLEPQPSWDVEATASSFDPGELLAGWEGDLEAALDTSGQWTDDGPQADLVLRSLEGTLRGRPVSGRADLSVTPPNLAGELELTSGGSTLTVTGEPGDELDADIRVDVASLNEWWPDAAGSVRARFQVTGTWQSFDLAGEAEVSELTYAGARVDEAALQLDLAEARAPTGSLKLRARNVEAGAFAFDTVTAAVTSPAPNRHLLAVSVAGERLDAEIGLVATRRDVGWNGSVDRLTLDLAQLEPLDLTKPAPFETAAGKATLEPLCLTGLDDLRLCIDLEIGPGQQARVHYELDAAPLGLVDAFAPQLLPGDLDGFVSGDGELTRDRTGRLGGRATLLSASARLHFLPEAETDRDAGESLLLYEDLELGLELAGARATAEVTGALGGTGHFDVSATLDGIGEARPTLAGSLDAELPALAPLAPFVPQVTELDGRLDADLEFGGTLDAPELSGRLSARDLAAAVPGLGLHLRNGTIEVTPRSGRDFALTGSIESGDGKVTIDGSMALDRPSRWCIEGDRFLAADLPAGKVIITPDLQLERDTDRIELTGEMRIPRANIDVEKLPQGRVQQISPDVVIVDARPAEDEALPVPLHAEVEVKLGDDVDISGYGLEAGLSGSIVVTEQPDRATLASGTINVQGGYYAYGQDLTIAHGQLLFAGSPIDNPRLDIVAQREIDEITAGLRIGGTARNPEVSVFSNPALGDADALSYLVAGRPLSEIGTRSGDADALATATRSIGGAAGGLVAEAVGDRLGIDEVSVEENEAIGGSAFTLGEYLSPRLYLGYGVGLFEPGEVITLRYLLSDDWAIEAVQAPAETRAGIEYQAER